MKSATQKALFIEKIKETPIIQIACKKADIGRATYYRWINKDQTFKENVDKALSNGRELVNDVVESSLIVKAKEGNVAAIRLWLTNNCPRYSDKKNSMSPEDKEKLSRIILSVNSKKAYKSLIQILLDQEVPKSTIDSLTSIIEKFNRSTQLELKTKNEKGRKMQNFTILERTVPSNPELKKNIGN